jgi:hypothetical protein
MSAARDPRPRHLQEASQINPSAARHDPLGPDTHSRSDEPAESPPAGLDSAPLAPAPAPELTTTQIYRAHLAASHVAAVQGIDFAEAAPADQVLWLNQLRGDVIELLRMLQDRTTGL